MKSPLTGPSASWSDPTSPDGLDRNQELTEKLIKGVSVVRATGGDGPHSRNVTVRFIDFDPANQDNN